MRTSNRRRYGILRAHHRRVWRIEQIRLVPGRGGLHRPDPSPLAGGALDIHLYEIALRDESLPRVPKHVLLYLIFRCGESKECWPSQKTIARQLCYSRQSVSDAITTLRTTHFIETKTKGRILVYDLSSWATCQTIRQVMSPRPTSTCQPSRHRTSIELANITSVGSRGGKVHYSAQDIADYAAEGIEVSNAR